LFSNTLLYGYSFITDGFEVPDNINKDVTQVYVIKHKQEQVSKESTF